MTDDLPPRPLRLRPAPRCPARAGPGRLQLLPGAAEHERGDGGTGVGGGQGYSRVRVMAVWTSLRH
jgi:hypothetical protein